MARYRIRESASIAGHFHEASESNQVIVTLPDSAEPSRTWVPLDEGAVAALKKLGVKNAAVPKGETHVAPPSAPAEKGESPAGSAAPAGKAAE